MDSLWIIVAVMSPVVIVGVGIIALIIRYDREIEDGLNPKDREEHWITLI
jgi:hypothetical protein